MTNDTNQPKNAEDMTLRTDFLGDQDDTAPSGKLPKSAIKGMAITAIAVMVAMVAYSVMPFDVNANKGLALLIFVGIFVADRGHSCDRHSDFGAVDCYFDWHS